MKQPQFRSQTIRRSGPARSSLLETLERRQLLSTSAGLSVAPDRFGGPGIQEAITTSIEQQRGSGQNIFIDYSGVHGVDSTPGKADGTNGKGNKTSKPGSGNLHASTDGGSGNTTNGGTSGSGSVSGDFDIVVNLSGSVTSAVQAAFDAAEAKWESILLGDLPDASAQDVDGNPVNVDDLYIDASIEPIDGVGGKLAGAGPNWVRGGSLLPITGVMQFDSADMANMESDGSLTNVIVHEMGHVLGIGTLWDANGLLSGAATNNPIFTGANAVAELDTFIAGSVSSISVEEDGGKGTALGHWNEEGESGRQSFGNELMTGFIDSGPNPLSRMTAASLADLGYPEVNLDGADLYNMPGENDYPTMTGLSASAATAGLTLTAIDPVDTDNSNSNGDNGDAIADVGFWRETNGLPGLQAGTSNPDVFLGFDTSDAGGWVLDVDDADLVEGDNTFHARPTDVFGAVGEVRSTTFNYQRDTQAPVLTDAQFLFETSQTIRFDFDEPLADPSADDLVVTNLTTGQAIDASNFSMTTSPLGDGERLEFTYTGSGRLPDGNYTATLPAGTVEDAAGNVMTSDVSASFFVLAGDTDRDRDVDFFDFLKLRSNYGQSDKIFSDGDFDYDGDVDFFDFLILRGNYGASLPPAGGSGSLFDGGDGDDSGADVV